MEKKRQDPWSPQFICKYCSKAFESSASDNPIWRELADLKEFRPGLYCGPECYLGDSVHFLHADEYQIAKRRIQQHTGRFITTFNRRTYKAPLIDVEFNTTRKKMRDADYTVPQPE